MSYFIHFKNVPVKATVCEILALFAELDYEPEEITLMDRRNDSVIFEVKRLDLVSSAVKLSDSNLWDHHIFIHRSSEDDLTCFHSKNRRISVDISCYSSREVVSIPPSGSAPVCETNNLENYNAEAFSAIGSTASAILASERPRLSYDSIASKLL
uniref:Uncharacterized protein n=1 Tax=Ditylenchus dipsaci TaxID=166011 RepID=A0A915EHC8_9BILA